MFQKCFSPAKQLHVTDFLALLCSVGRVGLSVSRIHASVWKASSFQQFQTQSQSSSNYHGSCLTFGGFSGFLVRIVNFDAAALHKTVSKDQTSIISSTHSASSLFVVPFCIALHTSTLGCSNSGNYMRFNQEGRAYKKQRNGQ